MLEWNNADNHEVPYHIEAVYIAVPHHAHAQILPELLSARLHVLKEKPAATTPEELQLYQDLAKSNSVLLYTASQQRYASSTAQMKE